MSSTAVSRRNLLRAGVAAGSAAVLGGGAEGRSITGGMPYDPDLTAAPSPAVPGAVEPSAFFTAEERAFIDAAVARFIPADELGPAPGSRRHDLHRSPARRRLRPGAELVHAGSVARRHPDPRFSKPHDAGPDVSRRHQGNRCALPPGVRQQGLRRSRGRRSGQGPRQPREGRDRPARRERRKFLSSLPAEHHRRLLLRSDLRRQPRHGRLEADWLSRRALRLPRSCRQARRALSAAAGGPQGPAGLDSGSAARRKTWRASFPPSTCC